MKEKNTEKPTTFHHFHIESERQIQSKILSYLRSTYPKALSLKLHEDPVFGVVGIPDIMFLHDGKALFFEVKRPGEKSSKIQESIMTKMINNGIMARVVYGVDDVRRIINVHG